MTALASTRRTARAASFAALTAAMLAAYEARAVLTPEAARAALLERYKHAWLTAVLGIFGVALDALPAGPFPPPPAGVARLVVANHRAALDIGVLLWLFGGHIVSRADLAAWPLVGRVARTGGTIFVDRAEGMSRAAAARAIRRKLEAGATVVLFPEGTTFAGDEVRPFHAGALAAARGLAVEVIPVGLAYEPGVEFGDETFLAHLGRTSARKGTRVAARIGAPRRLVDGADARSEASALRGEVQSLVHSARAALA